MTYRPGLLADFNATHDFAALQAELPDGYAYGVFTSDLPILHAYLLDPAITQATAQLAAHGTASLVDRFRMLVLQQLLRSTESLDGEVWELGVYRGGTALLIRNTMAAGPGPGQRCFRLFDTFCGLPQPDPEHDLHREGEFADVSLDAVKAVVGADDFLDFRPGMIPHTFVGLEKSTLRFAHVDLDLYEPIAAAVEFIYPRLLPGGIMVFDDYGFATCPGARAAVDAFCVPRRLPLVVLPTGQAFLIKR